MSIHIDKVLMTSAFESYKNYAEYTFDITTSGSIPVNGIEFTHQLVYDRQGTITEVYYKLSTNTYWRPMSVLARATDSANVGYITPFLNYAGNSLTVGMFVTNFGASPYTATTETWNFVVKVFDAPVEN